MIRIFDFYLSTLLNITYPPFLFWSQKMTQETAQEETILPKLVGTNFVRDFRNYLLKLINEQRLTSKEIEKKCFMELNIKSKTTRSYLREMVKLEIIKKDKFDKYSLM